MSISVIEFFNRMGRRARGGDFTRLSMSEQQDLMQAANASLMRLYNALPVYFKELPQGFDLPGPTAITGVGVTQNGTTTTGTPFTAAQFGQSVALDGDPSWNTIIGTNELMNPYYGPTGTVQGTVYGDALFTTKYPLDRIIGDPMFANPSLNFLGGQYINRANGNMGGWLFQQNIGRPLIWWPQVFGNSQGNSPIMVLKFAPAPDQLYVVNVRIGLWPHRLTLTDYSNNTALVVPDQFIETSLIPMAIQELKKTLVWQSRGPQDDKDVELAGVAGENFARSQVAQIGAPNNKVFTPIGY